MTTTYTMQRATEKQEALVEKLIAEIFNATDDDRVIGSVVGLIETYEEDNHERGTTSWVIGKLIELKKKVS